jgi:hypothetical protein
LIVKILLQSEVCLGFAWDKWGKTLGREGFCKGGNNLARASV